MITEPSRHRQPHDRQPGPLRLLQFSDLHLLGDPAEKRRGLDADGLLERVLAAAAAALRRCDLVLLTGDLTEHGDAAAYRRIGARLRHLHCPLLTLPGNHDCPATLARYLPSTGRAGRCAVDLGRWRLLLLDSAWCGHSEGRLTRDRRTWLQDELGRADSRHRLVFVHHPPLLLGSAWMDAIGLVRGAGPLRAAAARGAVSGVLFGHAHQDHDRRLGAVRYLGCPSTGRQFRPGTATVEIDPVGPGWREIALYPNGRLRTWIRRLPAGEYPG